MPALKLLISLLLPGTAAAAPPAPGPTAAPPAWIARCLPQLRAPALEQGAPLPTDSPRGTDYGVCAARCESRCFLGGDFDGDGQKRELAVASPTELLIYHEVERQKGRRAQATPAGRLALTGDEVALVPVRRAARFADEVGLLRDGKSPLPVLPRNERLAFGLIVWRGVPPETEAGAEGDEDDHGHSSETGELMLAIFDESARTYRLQRVLQLGGGTP